MRLAPLLLLLLPLALVLVQLLLRWGLQRRTDLVRSAHRYRPPRGRDTPVLVEVDVDSSPLFDCSASLGTSPHYLVFDTETLDVLHEEEVGEDSEPSPLILLSWQVLDAMGGCLSEETHLIRRTAPITEEATSLHGISTEDMEREGEELRLVLHRFLQVVSGVKILVAHNVRFHRTLVRSELSAVGLPTASLDSLPTLCTMERGRVLGFKRRDTGEALYPKLGELFGYLYLHQPEVSIRFHQKGLRDVRLCAACLRQLIL